MKFVEYFTGIIGIVLIDVLMVRIKLVTDTLAAEGVNQGDFFVGVAMILFILLTVLFAVTYD